MEAPAARRAAQHADHTPVHPVQRAHVRRECPVGPGPLPQSRRTRTRPVKSDASGRAAELTKLCRRRGRKDTHRKQTEQRNHGRARCPGVGERYRHDEPASEPSRPDAAPQYARHPALITQPAAVYDRAVAVGALRSRTGFMRSCVSFAATVMGMVGLLSAVPAAVAQDEQNTTFAEAAALVDYPVFAPQRVLGLRARVVTVRNLCVPAPDKRMLIAGYGRRSGQGPQFRVLEAKPFVCGDPGESRPFRTVRIHGRKVPVRVECESPEPECKLNKGRKHGYVAQLRLRSGPGAGCPRSACSPAMSPSARSSGGPQPAPCRPGPHVSLRRVPVLGRDGVVQDRGPPRRRPLVRVPGANGFGASVYAGRHRRAVRARAGGPLRRMHPGLGRDDVTSARRAHVGLRRLRVHGHHGAITCTVKEGVGAGRGFRVGPAEARCSCHSAECVAPRSGACSARPSG